jgi:hypothetical protein
VLPTMPYKTGRKAYSVVKELVISCRSRHDGSKRWRCSSPGCEQSWGSYQAQRLLDHAIQECKFIEPDLLERASEQSCTIALGEKVAKLNREVAKSATKQSSLLSVCTKEGLRAQQTRFDFSVANFVSAAQLAPRKVDLPEFRAMISQANTQLQLFA